MAIFTLSQALDRTKAGEAGRPIAAPVCAKVRASMAHAAITLARQSALKATKRQLQAQGLKPHHFAQRELVSRAEQYLAAHREELIAEAREIVTQWQRQGYFGRGRRSKLKTSGKEEKA
jgi:hypothetical protein